MLRTFLCHQYKAFWRSKSTGKSVAMRIVLALLIAYILINVLAGAFFLDKLLIQVYPQRDVIDSFNSFLLYYFLFDLLSRFHLQELPTLRVKPYLHLRVKKNRIVNYLSLTSLATAFNLSPFLLVLPFLSKVVLPRHGAGGFWGVILAVLGMTLFNHFFTLWLKRKVNVNAFWILGFLGALLLLTSFDYYFGLFSISELSTGFFRRVVAEPVYALFTFLPAIGIYLVNHQYQKNNLYLDELHSSAVARRAGSDIPFLDRFGRPGILAANELKLILRNKRPRSVLMLSAFFMLYGLIFYGKEAYAGYGWIVFCGSFMTGIFIINYGQLMFSWQSAHFDALLVHKISVRDFFASKFLLFTIFSTVCFVLTIPYVYFGGEVLIVHSIMYLWNLGVNTVLVLFFANRNYKRMDLSKGGSFNWEGFGATQWILAIPLFVGPYIVYVPLQLLGYPKTGLALLGIAGLVFLIMRGFWIGKLAANFNNKRYTIAEGFRNQ